jgi:hypothetical protein
MNDKEFDKHFREELAQEIQQPFDDKLWDNLSQRLDEHDKGKTILGGITPQSVSGLRNLYWLAPLMFLLLGTNVWYMWNSNKTKNDNEKLIGEIQSLKTILEKRDTVVKTKIIYKIDTIYIDRKTSSVERKVSISKERGLGDLTTTPSVFYSQKSLKSPLKSSGIDIKNTTPQKENSKTDLSFSNQNTTQLIDNKQLTNKENLNSDLQKKADNLSEVVTKKSVDETEKPAESKLALPSVEKLPFLIAPNIIVKENKNALLGVSMPIKKPVPFKHLYFGLTGSWLNYQTAWTNNAGLEVFRTEKSYQVGLRMEYAFNENWRLTLGSDYCPFDFNISWKDPRYNLPDIPDEYQRTHKMKSVEAKERLFNGFLGAKYIFNGTRARPYLGLAYSAMKISPYVANYRMQNLWTQVESDVAVQHPGTTISNLMMLTGGYEFKIGGRFVSQMEAFVYKDLNKEKKMFDLFGVRATVLARF